MRRASPLLETLRAAAQRASTAGLGYVPAALVLDALAELDAARDSEAREAERPRRCHPGCNRDDCVRLGE